MLDWNRIDKIRGWFDRAEGELLYAYAKAVKGPIVEIGTFEGRSTACLASGSRDGHGYPVFAVDPHENYSLTPNEKTLDSFLRNMKDMDLTVFPMVMHSSEAASRIDGTVAMVFIDGDHEEVSVRQDIYFWLPHLQRGGIMAFHDYGFPAWPGVKIAVDDAVAAGTLKWLNCSLTLAVLEVV